VPIDASPSEPAGNVGRVKTNEAADLQVRHAALGDEPADVAHVDAEVIGELLDGEEVGKGVCRGYG